MSLHKIAVIGGDGIGPEVTWEACKILKVLQNVLPELKLDLPPTAIGKDYLGSSLIKKAPSGTGFQFSLGGLLGVLASWEVGLEVNIFGLVLVFCALVLS